MKKKLITFAIAFFLAIGLLLTYSAFTSLLMRFFPNTYVDGVSISATINALFIYSVGPVVSFAVFYFSATRIKIRASKTTTLSMFLGSLTGSLLFILVEAISTVSAFRTLASALTILSMIGVSLCFIPSVTAVLYAELKEKILNN